MKRITKLGTLLFVLAFGSLVLGQSLAEAARAAKAEKKASPREKVYTNDDFDTAAPVVKAADKEPADEPQEAKASKGEDSSAKDDDKAAAAKADDWKKKINDQKKQVADLERELNLMEREHQVKVSVYYADAGSQLRDSKKWFEEEKQYETDHSAKQKGLADARQKLDDLKEQARKAGVPAGQIE